mmetsp:Transcript_35590/g.80383  ORF Transcript_35590/g.80383 Transcript_35590/m.80383 type:complete len:268 (+) Transcript_35590:380-1183(+)
MLPLSTAVTPSSHQVCRMFCRMGKWSSWDSVSSLCILARVVYSSRASVRMSIRLITVKAGSIALFVCVRAEMPPRPLPTRLVSKYGSAILFATKIAARLEEQSGRTAFGKAKTSKTVMAMANARQTAAQKAAEPTMARRAWKAPRTSSEIGPPSGVESSRVTSASGMRMLMTRPSRPPMIIVGATTPAGLGKLRARMVVVHFMRKQRIMVISGPNISRLHWSSLIIRSLLNSVDSNRGWGLPPSNGKFTAKTVFNEHTTMIWKRSRH